MPAGMGDYAFSMQMRDTIARMVKEQIDAERPRYRYARVTGIDRPGHKCNVIFNGETGEARVNMGVIQPKSVGQIVRVEGIGTDKFITDVVGGYALYDAEPITSGVICINPTSTLPAGFLFCDGAAVSRTVYSSLFTILGTLYGIGDNSTTFNLPNLRGRVPVGANAAEAEFNSLGKTGGAKTHTLTANEMPVHKHLGQTDAYGQAGGWGGVDGAVRAGAASYRMYNQDTYNAGGGAAHNNLQPYVTMNYIIKT